MDSLFILIPIAVIFSGIAASLFIWAVNHQQFDDLDKESERILFDNQNDRRKPE